MKDDELITEDDDKYVIQETVIPEDLDTNKFTSVSSKLSWNLENFSENKLDHSELNFTISCQVDENDIGQAISSKTQITVECEFRYFSITISYMYISVKMLLKMWRFLPLSLKLKKEKLWNLFCALQKLLLNHQSFGNLMMK